MKLNRGKTLLDLLDIATGWLVVALTLWVMWEAVREIYQWISQR